MTAARQAQHDEAPVGLILLAAGQGTRLGAGMPKALVPLGHGADATPIVVHALRSALACGSVTDVVVVAPADPDGMAQLTAALRDPSLPDPSLPDPSLLDRTGVPASYPQAPAPRVRIVPGGAERPDSVAAGLAALPDDVGLVLVHDSARALTPAEVFDRVVHAVRSGHPAVTPALPVVDTIKEVRVRPGGQEVVTGTVDRSSLRAVQTPQGFLRETLERAHAEVEHPVTDDCGMVEALGGQVLVVLGDPRAMKITTPHDLELAATWLPGPDPRSGDATGTDVSPVGVGQAGTGPGPGTALHDADADDEDDLEDDADDDQGSEVLPEVGAPAASGPLGHPALVVLSGLPGVGKTEVARALSRRVGAAHLRVDTLEQSMVRTGLAEEALDVQGYAAAYELALDQLGVGLPVVADMVNGIPVAREAWADVARRAEVPQVRVLLECSDPFEHQARVEGRVADIEGHRLPVWDEVQVREVEPWPEADLVLDTAYLTPDEAAAAIEELLR